jgi:serine/threonine protein phosphatase 1
VATTYAIADIHGRHDLLCRAISLIERHAGLGGGRLIVLGDYVDRGPQSAQVIDVLKAGPFLPRWRWDILAGNHEAMMVEVLGNPEPGNIRWWVGNGGGETLRSYGYQQGDSLLPLKPLLTEHVAWLATLPVYIEDEHRIFVHAGVPHDVPLDEATPALMQWMLHEGDIEDVAGFPDAPHLSGKHLVHGHHQDSLHPLLKPWRTNLDAFAWHDGRLAIGVFDDDKPGGPVEILWALA